MRGIDGYERIQVCRKAPRLSHMFFADDFYLYCRVNKEETNKMLELLNKFEVASSQKVNARKSSIFFSSNTLRYNREEVCNLMQMPEADNHSSYLDLPNLLGRNKSVMLGFFEGEG